MNKNELLVLAIKKLRPTSEFSIIGGDYSAIQWDVLVGDAPTKTEVQTAIAEIESDLANEEAAKLAAAASAVAKLEAIGLTAEEIAAIRG